MPIFSKNPKNPILGPLWTFFCLNFVNNEFSWKNGLCQFLNIPIIYHCVKNQKKPLGKNDKLTDGQMDRQTDRQTTVIS